MSTHVKTPYPAALAIAEDLQLRLAPYCERTLIAGSLRREKELVSDIELVVQPKLAPVYDIFEQPIGQHSLLDAPLLALISPSIRTKDGPRYKQFDWCGVVVDLFIASRETWGCVATIRTGSALFTQWLVSPRRMGGGCPAHLQFKDGRIYEGDTALDTPDERDVFALLGLDWVEPARRVTGRWRQ